MEKEYYDKIIKAVDGKTRCFNHLNFLISHNIQFIDLENIIKNSTCLVNIGNFKKYSVTDNLWFDASHVDCVTHPSILLYQGDITKLKVDAIVNAANNSLLGGGGVDGAIHNAAGPGLLEECKKLGGCATGEAKMTWGYRLPALHVIHTVGPVGSGDDLLSSCYHNCLKLAIANKLCTIAFCCISTGVYRFPAARATQIALKTVHSMIKDKNISLKYIIFCTHNSSDTRLYSEYISQIFPTEHV